MRPWVIAHDGSNPDYPFGFSCLRCGEKRLLAPSIELDKYFDECNLFRSEHVACEKNESASEKILIDLC